MGFLMALEPLYIAVIEDSAAYLAAITSFLSMLPEVAIVGTADDASGAIRIAEEKHPNLMLRDVFLREGSKNGLDVLRHFQSCQTQMAIVAMTTSPSRELEQLCRQLGGAGFYEKSDVARWLPLVVRQALAGKYGPEFCTDNDFCTSIPTITKL
jgi:DNA-binding NarL/FixJ family response regulator